MPEVVDGEGARGRRHESAVPEVGRDPRVVPDGGDPEAPCSHRLLPLVLVLYRIPDDPDGLPLVVRGFVSEPS
jgi:hypothetical protein